MDVATRKALQSEATRQALLDAARRLFAEHGYAATATEEIVRQAGVTRGALYYQFKDKEDLFRAVCREMEAELYEAIRAETRAQGLNYWDRFMESVRRILDRFTQPDYCRILLLDRPAVLGWDERASDDKHSTVGRLARALKGTMRQGFVPFQRAVPLARLLMAAIFEAGEYIVHAEDQAKARAEMGEALERLLTGLRVDQPEARGGRNEDASSS